MSSSGKHTKYLVYVYQTVGTDKSEDIKLGVNNALGVTGHVNRVEEYDGKKKEIVQQKLQRG